MINYIDLAHSQTKALPFRSEDEFKSKFNKGWSFSNVYHFKEIRDVFLYLKRYGFDNLKGFTEICLSNKLPYEKTSWNERRILEHINALKNFGLVSETIEVIDREVFGESKVSDPLSESDFKVFNKIFFTYYRFKEILSWFIDPELINRDQLLEKVDENLIRLDSKAIFSFSRNSRFTDSFIYDLKNSATVYYVENAKFGNNEELLRFWDVFVKWASELMLIEKFNLKNLDYQLANNFKSLSCIYFIRAIDRDFDLISYLHRNYQSHYINVPKLIFRIALEFRFSIDDIKNLIIRTAREHSQVISLQRTSEIFIRNTEINFVPIVNDSYISHIQIN